MLEFLLALILTIFSVQAVSAPGDVSEKIIAQLEENLPEVILSVTPPANPTQVAQSEGESQSENPQQEEGENPDPDTSKQDAYNTRSEKPVGNVAGIAIENSPAIIACSDYPSLCLTPTPRPTLTPTPTPAPEPTAPPIIIDPPKPVPPICIHSQTPCPQIYCLDQPVSISAVVDLLQIEVSEASPHRGLGLLSQR